jgi:calpain-5
MSDELYPERLKFERQNYSRLKKRCQEKNVLFEDDMFPADNSSLFRFNRSLSGVVWKRPGELCLDPKLVVDGADAHDVVQGRLGNCWFVAASSVLASERHLWNKVIPDIKTQEFEHKNSDDYKGIFKFQFWRFGKTVEVVIDDRLPTINNQLIFTHSRTKNEFWSSLLEKAYAK